jgi:hypothetical protein
MTVVLAGSSATINLNLGDSVLVHCPPNTEAAVTLSPSAVFNGGQPSHSRRGIDEVQDGPRRHVRRRPVSSELGVVSAASHRAD